MSLALIGEAPAEVAEWGFSETNPTGLLAFGTRPEAIKMAPIVKAAPFEFIIIGGAAIGASLVSNSLAVFKAAMAGPEPRVLTDIGPQPLPTNLTGPGRN